MQSETRSDSRLFSEVLRTLLREGISVRFHASGNSMHPAISDGSEVQVVPLTQAQRGDVVMVETSEGMRVHRVVARRESIRTRGDCCFEEDIVTNAVGAVGVVNGEETSLVRPQKLASIVRRWIARWRGHF